VITECGSKKDFKHSLLTELCGWTCSNGHHIVVVKPHALMTWEAVVAEYGDLWGCDECIDACQTILEEAGWKGL